MLPASHQRFSDKKNAPKLLPLPRGPCRCPAGHAAAQHRQQLPHHRQHAACGSLGPHSTRECVRGRGECAARGRGCAAAARHDTAPGQSQQQLVPYTKEQCAWVVGELQLPPLHQQKTEPHIQQRSFIMPVCWSPSSCTYVDLLVRRCVIMQPMFARAHMMPMPAEEVVSWIGSRHVAAVVCHMLACRAVLAGVLTF